MFKAAPALACTVLFCTGATPVLAQATPDAVNSTGAVASDQLGDIIVRAQRRDESLQNVPVAVTPVSGDDLQARKLNDLAQISLALPSLSIGSDNSFSIRGVGSQIFAANVDSSVGVAVDDVSLGAPLFMSNGILTDLRSVEELSGPQGLLFGRNASAGLLNIVTNKPVIGKLGGDLDLEYDNRDTAPGGHFGDVAKATLNLPVSENSALRVNLVQSWQDPIVKNIDGNAPGSEDFQSRVAVKAKYLWLPANAVSVYLIGDYSRERGIGAIFDRAMGTVSPVGLDAVLAGFDGIHPGSNNLQFASDGLNLRSVDTGGVSLNTSYDFAPSLTLSNIAAWRSYKLSLAFDSDLSSLNLLDTNQDHELYNQYSDELRLAIRPGSKLDGQAGLYAFRSTLTSDRVIAGDGQPVYNFPAITFPELIGGTNDIHQIDTSLAAFGQFNYHLTDALTLLAGGRVTRDRVSLDTAQVAFPLSLVGPTTASQQSYAHTNFSYKLGGQYNITHGIMGYVTYGTGYKGPTFNEVASYVGQDLVVHPETDNDLEFGLKSWLFDHRLRLDIAVFFENFDNFQVQAYDIVANGLITKNAAQVKANGVEISGSTKPLHALTINAAATFLDAKFKSFPGASCSNSQIAAGLCAPNGTFNASGMATPASAKFTSSLEGIYEIPLDAGHRVLLEGNYYHHSSLNFSPTGSPLTEVGTVDLLGASIGLEWADSFKFSVFCKNCTNQLVPTYRALDPTDSALAHADSQQNTYGYDSVRTIGAAINAKF